MQRLTEEQVIRNSQVVEALIATFPEPRRAAVEAMFRKIGNEFFTAPASTREEYHGCFPGGLCDHSLRVIRNLRSDAKAFCPNRWDNPTLDFVGLMHDLGKVGDGEKPLYVPNPDDWRRTHRGELYVTNKEVLFMPVADRTMFLLQKFGIVLTAEEFVTIRISDGPYEESNQRYGMKEPDLALLLHWADRWACQQEKSA